MAIPLYPEILVAISLCFLFLCHLRWNKSRTITNWPVVGMLPGLLQNASNVHEYVTWLLKQNGGTFKFKGPWFTNMTFMVTSDPMNINHMLSKNFSNYTKGQKFQEIFDVLGDGIFNSDSDSWTYQRKLLHTMLKDNKFKLFFEQFVKGKVEKSLVPVLDHISSFGIEVDLQDIFQRFTFDSACLVVLGFDPNCLSIEFPDVSYAKSFDQLEECLLYRHIVPERWWKLQRRLQIGSEKKLSHAWKVFDEFVYECISTKREEVTLKKEELKFNLLTAIVMEEQEGEMSTTITKSDKFLRDTATNLLAAGRDSISAGLTWLFWLLATHPSVEAKILEEIKEHLLDNGKSKDLNIDKLSKLVYLHGAVCESLRLFPPIPFEHKCSVQPDILPSGHSMRPNTTILYSLYSMGRMESIWGEDCLDFKPERWITEFGGIVHVPSFKFIAFNAGARTCLGKDIAFIQMKIIATAIIWKYHVRVVEDHPVSPSISVVLHMKHGLKVRISKRYA
ncbi:noroxomaritidine synthase-like [Quercus lobata]|uniref:Cytochrome P450 n=1 Tax=Quercus lobata TaxID=97700 RepID=A0A7N2KZW1_QUELO|nr:noroxomaritidine synthase-like [Quercus lobata]